MKRPMIIPCAEWAVLLAINSAERASAEQQALAEHLTWCQACRSVQTDYALQDAFLRQQPLPALLESLPPSLLAEWAAEEGYGQPTRRLSGPVPMPARTARRSRRLPVLVSAVAAVLAVALLVAALLVSRLPTGNHPAPTAQGTRTSGISTPTGTPVVDGTWVIPPGLSQVTSAATIIMAPSNPNIIYKMPIVATSLTAKQAVQLSISRSEDGGLTWQSSPVPVPENVNTSVELALDVSPLDAHVVLLEFKQPVSTFCTGRAPATVIVAYSGATFCYAHYISQDGGQHWKEFLLPNEDTHPWAMFFDRLGYLSTMLGNRLIAQGTRLYAKEGNTDLSGEEDFITSSDGGQTWRMADQPITAAHLCLMDAMPAPQGATILAIVIDAPCRNYDVYQLWRSDDAGTTWHQVGTFSDSIYLAPAAPSQGRDAVPLLFARPSGSGLPTPGNLKVSIDGGATWAQAPEQGIAPNWYDLEGPLWVLGDGSVMLNVVRAGPQRDQYTSTLYRWKSGDTAWHQVAPPAPGRVAYLLVLEHPETIWMVTWTSGNVYTARRLSRP